jgi:hypothetical protein
MSELKAKYKSCPTGSAVITEGEIMKIGGDGRRFE